MELAIILKSLRRNKIGAVVIAVQIAVTLAILGNALFIIQQCSAASHRPSGVDEADLFMLKNQWIGDAKDLPARLRTDLDALRGLGGVVDAYATDSVPLSNGGDSEGLGRDPDQVEATVLTAMYYGDEHALATLGVKLIAGRNFQPDEIVDRDGYNQHIPPNAVIITRALAEKLFPQESPIGKPVYISFDKHAVPVVGVIDMLQVPWSGGGGWGSRFFYNSILVPYRWSVPYMNYVIRTKPGQFAAIMKTVPKMLTALNRDRVLVKTQPLSVARVDSYKDDHGLAVILGTVCVALLLVTAFGIVGLTSYWVAQRRRQIGIRRALGAHEASHLRLFSNGEFPDRGAGGPRSRAARWGRIFGWSAASKWCACSSHSPWWAPLSCCCLGRRRRSGRRCAPPPFHRRWRRAAADTANIFRHAHRTRHR